MKRRWLRFVLLLAVGLIAVWVLGVRSGETFFGRKPDRVKVDPEEARRVRESEGPSDVDVALTGAMIPIREELPDQPGVLVLKYAIHIGHSASGGSKRMPAQTVVVDIYNKKPPPEERILARASGDEALIEFDSPPDPKSGFRDTLIESMTFTKNTRVDYLDEAGEPATTMTCDELQVTEERFRVPGHAVITQEGLKVEGDVLSYEKATGAFEFERNVKVEGTRFALPETGMAEEKPAAEETPAAAGAPPAEQTPTTVSCGGRFSYVPAAEEEGGAGLPGDEAFGKVKGGLITFRENVTGTQDQSTLLCEELEITLESVKKPERAQPAEQQEERKDDEGLEVTRVIARGTPGRPALLKDPQGTLEGETLTMVKTEAGQVVTLLGEPRIHDATFGGPKPAEGAATPPEEGAVAPPEGAAPEEGATEPAAGAPAPPESRALTFSAGARRQIQLRPVASAPGEAPPPEGAPKTRKVLLELEDTAFLETKSDTPENDFRIEGHRLHLDVLQSEKETPEGKTTDMRLERLLATGAARGLFSGGVFTGDQVEAFPRAGSTDSSQFEIHVSPNPDVLLVSKLEGEAAGERRVHIRSDQGELTYVPAAAGEEQTQAVFTGPTLLTVEEAGQLTTTLNSETRVTVVLDTAAEKGGDALSSMVAEGNVSFENVPQGVTGTGERLTLLPTEAGRYRFRLSGSAERPAVAHAAVEGEASRDVAALDIDFDPDSGRLSAKGRVEARGTGLALGAEMGPALAEAEETAEPSVLKCEDLQVFSDESGGSVVEARTAVRFEDPSRRLSATADQLFYEETAGKARLLGREYEPAFVTRGGEPSADGRPPRTVSIGGPEVLLDQASNTLTCERNGAVRLVLPEFKKEKEQCINGRSAGPLRYFQDRLVLQEDVVVGFANDGTETRALWCDLATVLFATQEPEAGAEEGAAAGETAGAVAEGAAPLPGSAREDSGFDRLIAEGRVHLEEVAPREMIGEGQRLEWIMDEADEVLILSGTNPQCWIVGLLGDKDFRDEADWFRLHRNSNEVQAENGRTVFVQEVSRR